MNPCEEQQQVIPSLLLRIEREEGAQPSPSNGSALIVLRRAAPFLLKSRSHPEAAVRAAASERRTGDPVLGGPASGLLHGRIENELDLWEPQAPVGAARARDWWKTKAARFGRSKRYQAGLNVSDDPLGPVFDQLPLAIRYNVYLRERALTSATPDWELEMWTWKQKNPVADGNDLSARIR